MKAIDINCDLGEGFGPYHMGDDEMLLDIVTSANIACGFHAGDPVIMGTTVRAAISRGVDVGAHVGYPDRAGFGRRPIQMDARELTAMTLYQLGALHAIAQAAGATIKHLTLHGALGNLSFVDQDVADTVHGAVKSFDPTIRILTMPGTVAERSARSHGLPVSTMFLADRAYDDQGLLVSRKLPGAVIHEPAAIEERVRMVVTYGHVTSITGKSVPVEAKSILVHGDTRGAVDIAKLVRDTVRSCGGAVTPLSQLS
jgi:UPF0271 protein